MMALVGEFIAEQFGIGILVKGLINILITVEIANRPDIQVAVPVGDPGGQGEAAIDNDHFVRSWFMIRVQQRVNLAIAPATAADINGTILAQGHLSGIFHLDIN